jgi:hypothetical protein
MVNSCYNFNTEKIVTPDTESPNKKRLAIFVKENTNNNTNNKVIIPGKALDENKYDLKLTPIYPWFTYQLDIDIETMNKCLESWKSLICKDFHKIPEGTIRKEKRKSINSKDATNLIILYDSIKNNLNVNIKTITKILGPILKYLTFKTKKNILENSMSVHIPQIDSELFLLESSPKISPLLSPKLSPLLSPKLSSQLSPKFLSIDEDEHPRRDKQDLLKIPKDTKDFNTLSISRNNLSISSDFMSYNSTRSNSTTPLTSKRNTPINSYNNSSNSPNDSDKVFFFLNNRRLSSPVRNESKNSPKESHKDNNKVKIFLTKEQSIISMLDIIRNGLREAFSSIELWETYEIYWNSYFSYLSCMAEFEYLI